MISMKPNDSCGVTAEIHAEPVVPIGMLYPSDSINSTITVRPCVPVFWLIKQIDNEAHATIFVDHCSLLNQLMGEYQTYKLIPIAKNDCVTPQVSLAIITKATPNNSPKNKWLRELLAPILNNVDITLL